MSFQHIAKLWIATKEDLKDVFLHESVLKQLQPTKSRNQAHALISNLYARYIIICNNLSELYDQTLQVQKRSLIEKLITLTQERLMEIQKDLQNIEMSKFVYIDDALVELNLTPYDIEFLRPFYFPRKRDIECQQLIDYGPKNCENDQPDEVIAEPKGLDKFRVVLSPEEIELKRKEDFMTNVVNVIISHEKARQARMLKLNVDLNPVKYQPVDDDDSDEAEDEYEFHYKEDQVGIHKIKRTSYHMDLYSPKVEIIKYDYFQPAQYKLNRLGHKVFIPKVKNAKLSIEEIINEDDDQFMFEENLKRQQSDEEEKLKASELLKRQHEAARVIQRNFLYYQLKKTIKRRNTMRMEMCGMLRKQVDLDAPNINEIHLKSEQKRRERKREFDEALLKAVEDEKAQILKIKSEFIMEDITDDIRAWLKEFYDKARDFHRYPEEFEGGTILVMRGETKTPEAFLKFKNKSKQEKVRERKMKKKIKAMEKKMKLKAKEIAMKREIERKKTELKEGKTFDFTDKKEWKALEFLTKAFNDGENDWKFIEEMKNRKELPIWEWVTLDAYCDVHKELRRIVDNLMRFELEYLRFALSVDLKKNYKPSRQRKEKRKKKSKKKQKPLPDVMEGRSFDECYEELTKMNIIRQYEKRSLNDFIGNCSYAAREFRSINKDPPPQYGDIKNYIQTEVLGTAAQIKSICIMGPEKCGKKFLVNALCTEMEALMFDLSASNIKDVKDMPYFLNLVLQVAVKFQPSVLLIDGAHKPFIKKINAQVKSENPRKLGKYLFKNVVKYLTNDDAVVLIGVTNEPWNCNVKLLKKCYEKFAIFPPKIDYGTALKAWETGLKMKRIINFDVSSLGQVTKGFSVGDILESIDSCLDINRRVTLHYEPLTCNELLENLITTKKPIQESIVKQFNKIALKFDPFVSERKMEIARVQAEIDKIEKLKKEAELRKQRKEAKEKKQNK